ncbi:hypothetical protein GCM10020000_17160 [Streptomyces olivoverticillatus]
MVFDSPPGSARTSGEPPAVSHCRSGGSGIALTQRSSSATGAERVDDLAGGHDRALRHGVAAAELHRVQVQFGRQLVHLRLIGEAGLHRAEAAHGAAGRVVGVEGDGLDVDVVDDVRADGQRGGVADDGRGGGGVGAAVEHDARLDVAELAVAGGAVLVAELGGVAVDVPEEGLEAVVDDLHGLAGVQGEQAGVGLHGQVLAAAEGAADAGERHAHLLLGQAEDGGAIWRRSACSHWVAM